MKSAAFKGEANGGMVMMKRLEENREAEHEQAMNSQLEILKMTGGKAHRVTRKDGRSPDSMLAVYKDRATYTFIFDDEVASIHFDKVRGEIFFKGHNIHNLELSERHLLALSEFQQVLREDEEGRALVQSYEATLGRLIADK